MALLDVAVPSPDATVTPPVFTVLRPKHFHQSTLRRAAAHRQRDEPPRPSVAAPAELQRA